MMRNAMVGCVVAVSVVLALGACSRKTPTEQASSDAQAVAQVERLSKAPFKVIVPTPIGAEEIARFGLDRPGCSFFKNGTRESGGDPLFIAARDEGFMLMGSDLKRYAAKSTAADLPGGARTTYTGLADWVDLVRLPDDGAHSDALNWPARLILHDSQERVAFMADGTVVCHR